MAIVAENRLPSARVVLRIGQRLDIPLAASASVRRVAVQQDDAGERAAAPPASPPPSPRVPAHLELGVPDADQLRGGVVWPIPGLLSSILGSPRVRRQAQR